MKESKIVEIEDRCMAPVYAKLPLTLSKGLGATVWDTDGKEYIDCMGAYGVAIVGHCHPKVVEAVRHQAGLLISCHGSIYNDTRAQLLQKLEEITLPGLDMFFLCNSGAETVECAIKLARKKTGKTGIIAFNNSYHGKTMGALSATWSKKYRDPFEPLVPGFNFARYGNMEEVKKLIGESTAAIIVEPVQGEGGIRVPPEAFLEELRSICDRNELMLIFDEVQSGFGRTGKMWASEHWKVVPDIMCSSKAVAGGVPMGITFAKGDVMKSFGTGDHTSTFGGNPLACAASLAAIEVIQSERLVEKAKRDGDYFRKKLEGLQEKFRIVREVRGKGLMIGVEMRFPVKDILFNGLERGLLLLYAGRNVLRFLP
ncbi:MAG: aspartate aminotransferase family protein, partial [Candidatus Bathyarchaeota archaeon]